MGERVKSHCQKAPSLPQGLGQFRGGNKLPGAAAPARGGRGGSGLAAAEPWIRPPPPHPSGTAPRAGPHLVALDLLPDLLGGHLRAAALQVLGVFQPHEGVLEDEEGSEPRSPSPPGPSSPLPPPGPGARPGREPRREPSPPPSPWRKGDGAGSTGTPGARPRRSARPRRFHFRFRSPAPPPGLSR